MMLTVAVAVPSLSIVIAAGSNWAFSMAFNKDSALGLAVVAATPTVSTADPTRHILSIPLDEIDATLEARVTGTLPWCTVVATRQTSVGSARYVLKIMRMCTRTC